MTELTSEQFQALVPLACAWAEEQEKLIIDTGVGLSQAQIEDARLVGVTHPERVRLLAVEKTPMPQNPELRTVAETTQLLSPYANGVAFRYGIFIRTRSWADRRLVVHELVHTAQYEKLGGFRPFLEQYLMECLTIGYPACPMEQEAIRVANEICGSFDWENN